MRVLANIDPKTYRSPALMAALLCVYLEGVIAQNRCLIRAGAVPPLFRSGVRFKPSPYAGAFEDFADAKTCFARGVVDCDQAIAIRIAEEREKQGAPFVVDDLLREWAKPAHLVTPPAMAMPKIYWKEPRVTLADFISLGGNLTAHQVLAAYGRYQPPFFRGYHAEMRLPDGSVEDTSRYIGM